MSEQQEENIVSGFSYEELVFLHRIVNSKLKATRVFEKEFYLASKINYKIGQKLKYDEQKSSNK